jgi:hypothetical protein
MDSSKKRFPHILKNVIYHFFSGCPLIAARQKGVEVIVVVVDESVASGGGKDCTVSIYLKKQKMS